MTEINCIHRSLNENQPVCRVVADATGLGLSACHVNDSACRHCLTCGASPSTPNSVVASMSIAAVKRTDGDMESIKRRMTPYLTRGPSMPRRVTAEQLPCIHRGELLRQIDCELCGDTNTKVDVHRCKLPEAEHDSRECTPGRWSKTPKQPSKVCLGCGSRQEPVQITPPEEPRPYLSIVMPTYDDWDGVWFTTQIIRSFFAGVLRENQTEIVCLDTNPGGKHGECCRKLFQNWCNGNPQQGDTVKGRYVAAGGSIGPAAAKQKAIEAARGEIVLCIDCHLILQPGCLEALVKYFRANPASSDLIHGPYLRDDFRPLATHMAPVWGGDHMKGVWAIDDRALDAVGNINVNAEPFEVPQMGMGFFACRREAWLGFNPLFRGFVVEEGYIHEKYRKAGHKAICIPACRWLHRTDRANGAPYSVNMEDRFAGYLIRAHELGEDRDEYIREFRRNDTESVLPLENYWRVLTETQAMLQASV